MAYCCGLTILSCTLKRVAPNSTLAAHSQGTIIMSNALAAAKASGVGISGFKVVFDGAAGNHAVTKLSFKLMRGPKVKFYAHSLDPVNQIIGANGLTPFNPYRLAGSLVVGTPSLFMGRDNWSAHSLRGGGKMLGIFPNWY